MDSNTVFLVVQSDIDFLAVCVDEKPHREESEGVSSLTGKDRAESFQETTARPSQRNNYGMKAGW